MMTNDNQALNPLLQKALIFALSHDKQLKQMRASLEDLTTIYPYKQDDKEVFVKVRFDKDGEKWVKPFHLDEQHGQQYKLGEPKKLDKKPLYLPEPLTDEVYIVEGEKCVHALIDIGISATTTGSANSVGKCDLTPLQGRKCVIWRDNDVYGSRWQAELQTALKRLKIAYTVIDVAGVKLPSGESLPPKADCFDFIEAYLADGEDYTSTKERIHQLPLLVVRQEQVGAKSGLSIINANDVQERPITWLWRDWLPLGKITILAGAGGCGKTSILLSLIATISKGGVFPDGSRCEHTGEVLIFSTEDDVADTLKPRLKAMEANFDNVNFITAKTNDKGETLPFDASEDLPMIYEYAKGRNVKLLMIDPIVTTVGKDMNKANEVRQSLQILVDFAQDFNCAVVGITHFTKGTKGATPAERVIGSQAFTALARMTWVASRADDDNKPCIIARAKSNISSLDGGFNYTIEPCTVDSPSGIIHTTKVVWGEFQSGNAKELLSRFELNEDEKPLSRQEEAQEFLIDLLREKGEVRTKEVQSLAKEADITPDVLRRAREVVCVSFKKSDGYYYWRLKQAYMQSSIIQNSIANLVDYGTPFHLHNFTENEEATPL